MSDEHWYSPTMKSELHIVESTASSNGERLEVEFFNAPDDIGPPTHVHPLQEETFTVIEGRLALTLNGEERVLGPGESVVVPRNTPHSYWNPGTEPVRFTSRHTPALGFERFITSLFDLDYDGLANDKGVPGPLQLMVMLGERPGEEYLVGPPRIAQRIAASVLGTVGRLLGYRPHYISERRRADFAAREPQRETGGARRSL